MFRDLVIRSGIRNFREKDKGCSVPDLYSLLSAGKRNDICSDSSIGSNDGNLSVCKHYKSFKWHIRESVACCDIGTCTAPMFGR